MPSGNSKSTDLNNNGFDPNNNLVDMIKSIWDEDKPVVEEKPEPVRESKLPVAEVNPVVEANKLDEAKTKAEYDAAWKEGSSSPDKSDSETVSPVAVVVAAPVAEVAPAMTFKEAFKAARAEQGDGGKFDWTNPDTGKTTSYSTRLKATASSPARRVKAQAQGTTAQAPAATTTAPQAKESTVAASNSASTDANTPFYSRAPTTPVGNSLANHLRRPIKAPDVFVPENKEEFHYAPKEPTGNSLQRHLARPVRVAGPAPV